MLHASAAFLGENIQMFWKGGRTLYGGTSHFIGGLDYPLETMFLLSVWSDKICDKKHFVKRN